MEMELKSRVSRTSDETLEESSGASTPVRRQASGGSRRQVTAGSRRQKVETHPPPKKGPSKSGKGQTTPSKQTTDTHEGHSWAPADREPPPPHELYTLHSPDSNWDYASERSVAKPTNVLESVVNLVKGCLGGGIMGVHESYYWAGIWVALLFNIIFGVYIAYCIWIIVHSAQILYGRLHMTEMSYPDVAELSTHFGPFPKFRKYGKVFRYSVDVIIMVDLFGSCCVYEIMIAKTLIQLKHTFEFGAIGGDATPTNNEIRVYLCIILLPILALCMIRSLKYLAPFSLVANCFIVLTVGATVYYGLASPTRPPLGDLNFMNSFFGFFAYSGVIVFSMEGVGVALPIENSMKNPLDFPLALIIGYCIVVMFVITVGFFGYWGFTSASTSPVTLNFPATAFPTVLKALMGCMIYVTFALNFWPPFNLCWYYISKKYDPDKHWIWERVYRAIIVVIITVVAIAFPNIVNLMGFLGGFCLSNMGFIFPALIELLVIWDDPGLGPGNWKLYKNCFIMLIGLIMFISATYTNTVELISKMG